MTPKPLTRQQQRILCLVEQGYTNRRIAEELVVELGTVKNHMQDIFNHLGVRKRRAAVVAWRQMTKPALPVITKQGVSMETAINHHQIILVSHRPDGRPPIAFVTGMNGRPRRYSLVDAQRKARQLREKLAVVEAVERMLAPVSVVGNSTK